MIDAQTLTDLIDTSWPAAQVVDRDGWRLRRTEGAGSRVRAATALPPTHLPTHPPALWPEHLPDIAKAEAAGARLFMVRAGETALDAALVARGYALHDPVVVLASDTAALSSPPPERLRCIPSVAPLAAARALWQGGGIGAGRLAVMARAPGPKAYLMGRVGDRPSGVAFIAQGPDRRYAMLHALHVDPAARRSGLGSDLMRGAALWARDLGIETLTLVVTEANTTARALYAKLGFTPLTRYHYRAHPDEET